MMPSRYGNLYKLYRLLLMECYMEEIKLKNFISPKRIVFRGIRAATCFICSGTEALSRIHRDQSAEETSSYSSLLASCFHIELVDESRSAEVCARCVARLQDAATFRKLVEEAGHKLLSDSHHEAGVLNDTKGINRHPFKACHLKSNKTGLEIAKENISKRKPILLNSKKVPDKIKHVQEETVNSLESFNDTSVPIDSPLSWPDSPGEPQELEQGTDKDINSFEFLLVQNMPDDNSCYKNKLKGKRRVEWYDQNQYPKHVAYKPPVLKTDSKDCPICKEIFESRSELNKHFDLHLYRFLCDMCGKSFSTRKNLMYHIQTHAPPSFACTQCSKTYIHKDTLMSHISKIHGKREPYHCPKCKIRFMSRLVRMKHMQEAHGVAFNKHTCGVCQKPCNSPFMLKRHMAHVHIMERNKPCPECNKVFTSDYGLREHIKTHSEIRNFGCDICGKAYKKKRNLRTHLNIHYDIRNFRCEHCGRAFVQDTSLKVHLRTHHRQPGDQTKNNC